MSKKAAENQAPTGGWDQAGSGETWDDLFPIRDSSDDSSSDDGIEHEPGTQEYQEDLLSRELRLQHEEQLRNQPAPVKKTWRDYNETEWGTGVAPPASTDTVLLSRSQIPDNEPFQRTAGRQVVINHALSTTMSLAQLGMMRANPLLAPRRHFEAGNMLLDVNRHGGYGRRLREPADYARTKLKEKALTEQRERDKRRPMGAPAARKSAATAFAPRRVVEEPEDRLDEPMPPASDVFDQSISGVDMLSILEEEDRPMSPSAGEPGSTAASQVKALFSHKRPLSPKRPKSRPYASSEVGALIRLGRKARPGAVEDAAFRKPDSPVRAASPAEESSSEDEQPVPIKRKPRSIPRNPVEDVISSADLCQKFEGFHIDRTCSFPNTSTVDPAYQGFHGLPHQLNSLSHSCFCGLDPEQRKDPRFVALLSEADLADDIQWCHASFRLGDSDELLLCHRPLAVVSDEERKHFWYPQMGAVGLFCEEHIKMLRDHQICPYCNEFLGPGGDQSYRFGKDFTACGGSTHRETHLYHVPCRKRMNLAPCCPHCLKDKSHTNEEFYDGKPKSLMTPQKLGDRLPAPSPLSGTENSSKSGQDILTKTTEHEKPDPSVTTRRNTSSVIGNPGADYGLFDGLNFELLEVPSGNSAPNRTLKCYVSRAEVEEMTSIIREIEQGKILKYDASKLKSGVENLELAALVRAQLSRRSTLNAVSPNGDALQHLAARAGKVAACLVLATAGASVNSKNEAGETALFVATDSAQLAVIYALLELGADVNTQNKEGETPLHRATWKIRNAKLIHFLVTKGASPNAKDLRGFTPVFNTLPWIPEADFAALIRGGANLVVQDADGWNLLHWIAVLHRNDLVKYFHNNEMAYMRDHIGETPVHKAVRSNNLKMIESLLMLRPPIDVVRPNLAGQTPLRLARKLRKWNIVALIERLSPEREDQPLLEVCGDISNGINIVPIPAYNFINHSPFPYDLLYLEQVVPTILQQDLPYNPRLWPDACHLPVDVANCADANCRCLKLKSRKRQDEIDFYFPIIDQCYCPSEREDPKTGTMMREVLSKAKPMFTEEYKRSVTKRLKTRMAGCSERMADDLQYILDLVDTLSPDNSSRRRWHSAGRNKGRPRIVRSPSADGRLQQKPKGERARQPVEKRDATAADGSNRREFERNEVDLFDELEQCDVDQYVEAALIRFEQNHHLERWDLSSQNTLAPRRHIPPKPPKRRYRTQPIPTYEELGMVRLPRRPKIQKKAFEHELPNRLQWPLIYECGRKCQCDINCPLRALHWPSLVRPAMWYVGKDVGWGVVALTAIQPGQYITEYTGELSTFDLYRNDTYLYSINVETEGNLSVDAKRAGNYSRFFNHSCRPSAKTTEVWAHGVEIPRLCIFALRTVRPLEPITLDYGDDWWYIKWDNDESFACKCGEPSCRFREPRKGLAPKQ